MAGSLEEPGCTLRRGSKKNWDCLKWLDAAYASTETGDLPAFEEIEFHRFSDAALERGRRYLPILELTGWNWTITDINAQPEEDVEAVMYLKTIGEKMRRQAQEQAKPPENPRI